MSKPKWPMSNAEREQLAKHFVKLDIARQSYKSTWARLEHEEEIEEELNAAGQAMIEANEAIMDWTQRFDDRYLYDYDSGWSPLGAPSFLSSAGDDIYDKDLIPNVGRTDDWLTIDSPDSPDLDVPNSEHRDFEASLRVAALTGWPGLTVRQRTYLTKLQTETATFAKTLAAWLKETSK